MPGRLRPLLQSPWAIVGVAVVLRLAVMVWTRSYFKNPALEFYDFGAETGRVARAIALGQGFSSPLHGETGPTAWLMPVYPYLLAGIFKVFGIYSVASAVVVVSLNCVFSGLTCLPIYHFGRRTLGEGVALGAAWAWAFYYWSIHVATQWIWDTSLYVLVVALVLQCTLEIPRQERLSRWVGYALLCGFAVMVNTSLALTLPFLGLWICLRRAQRPGWHAPVSVAAAVFLASLLPWFVHNYVAFGQSVFPRSNLGLELYLGNAPNPENDIFGSTLHPSANAAEFEQYQKLGELGYMAAKKRQAIEAIQADPGEFARRTFWRVVNWWLGPWENLMSNWMQGRRGIPRRPLVTLLVGVLGLAGFWLAWRDRREAFAVYAIVLFFFPLVYYITQANARYRLAVDPLLILLAVYAVVRWIPSKRGEPAHG
jgi:hypothetical protein